jgi:hypothetical protein
MRTISALLCLLLLTQCSSPPPKQAALPPKLTEKAAMEAVIADMEKEIRAREAEQTKQAGKRSPRVPAAAEKPPAPQPPPKTMTRLVVRLESAELKPGSFASKPRTFYRATANYCRIEEAPDPDNDIQGMIIMAQPDVWMVNLATKQGRHLLISGPGCRLPIFTMQEVKAAPDLKHPLLDLEFGRELEFFKNKAKSPEAGPVLQGKPTKLYTVKLEDSELLLFTTGTPEVPLAVILKKSSGEYTYTYDSYEQLPFNAKLFSKPEGVAIRERAVANQPADAKKKPGQTKPDAAAGDKPKAVQPKS